MPNLSSFAYGALVVGDAESGAYALLDEALDTTWELRDLGPDPRASAVIELAGSARIQGVRLTFDDAWTVRMPREVEVAVGASASGPFTPLTRVALPDPLPDTGDAPLVLDAAVSGEGRYVQITLIGRNGGPDEAIGPQLTDLAIHGTFSAPIPASEDWLGAWNAGWLLGVFELAERDGRLEACLSRDDVRAEATVEGRVLTLRWQSPDGPAAAILVRDGEATLRGVMQQWSVDGVPSMPGSVAAERVEGSDLCARSDRAASAIEQGLSADRRARIYGIHFDFASDVLRPESSAVIEELVAALNAHPDWQITIEGHTDAVGADDANQALSERRAAAVVLALTQRGIAAERLSSAGFGERQPVAPNDTPTGRAQNRRVEVALR